jgi:hypothetical protein
MDVCAGIGDGATMVEAQPFNSKVTAISQKYCIPCILSSYEIRRHYQGADT